MARLICLIGALSVRSLLYGWDAQLDSAHRSAAQMIAWENHAQSVARSSMPDSAFVFQGRLTTESGTPISTSDRVAQSTLYLTPFQGSRIAVYNGSRWINRNFTELSLSLSGLVTDSLYDVFVYDNAGTLALELSAAWTSATARSQAISMLQGVYTLTATRTRRYVGTFRATSATTTEDSSSRRFVYNYYNRTRRNLVVTETADTWSYTVNTVRQTNANTTNQVELIQGLSEDFVSALSSNVITAGATVRLMDSVIGLDSSTAQSAQLRGGHARNTVVNQTLSSHQVYPGIGYTRLSWNERGLGGTFFYGDNGGDDRLESGLMAWVEM